MIKLEDIDKAIRDAMESQAQDVMESSANWDIVHELVVHYHKQERKKKEATPDPLEDYCDEDPSANECRAYD